MFNQFIMGIEKDYLMRQLMMLIEVIGKIINFRKKGQPQEAQEEIRYFYSVLKLEHNLRELPAQDLYDYLVDKKKLDNNQVELVAAVMKEQGELAEMPGQQKAYFMKAWFLLDRVDRVSATFS